jgi:threonine dehydrogenase-like Zn-dependent dehydrogenase
VLGHEGVGIIESVGTGVTTFKPGDRVLISCITSCGKCEFCRKGMYSHCTTGGWQLGHLIDGTQAEYVRVPHADTSLYPIPADADEEALVMLSDILPTGFECGVLNGKVQPGSTVAIVGAGPVGLAALLTAQFYSPARIIVVDLDDNRLEVAQRFGATDVVNSADGKAAEAVKALTDGRGVDTAIEAVGIPATFGVCENIVAAGGTSPTSACTAPRWTCTWKPCGPTTSPSPPGWWIPPPPACCSRPCSRRSSTLGADHPPLHPRPGAGRLRDLRRRRQEQGAQGHHRGLILRPPLAGRV